MRKEASFISIGTMISVVVLAVSGGMFMGALASDVETLEEAQKVVKEDHDRLIVVESEVNHIKETADRTQLTVDRIEQMISQLAREE